MRTAGFVWAFIILATTLLAAQANPVPLIYQPLSPVSVKPGHATFALGVRGTGFAPGATVRWNGKPLHTRYISSSVLQALVPAAIVAKPSTGSVTVANPGSIASNIVYLSVRHPLLTVTTTVDAVGLGSGEVTVGDFNNDGRPDISVTVDSKDIAVYLNQGKGKFNSLFGPAIGQNVVPNVVADFNNDGNLDLGVAGSNGGLSNWTGICLGDGKGGFADVTSTFIGLGAVADMNGDGILDSISGTFDGSFSYVEIQLGNGNGTFKSPYFVQLIAGYSPGPPVIADFNGDGKLDVVVTGANPIAVFLGNGDGTLQNEVDYQVPSQYCVSYAAVADLNRDGKLDIVTSGGSVLLGHGDGTFAAPTSIPIPACANNVKIADINGDGKLDIATASYTGNAGDQTLNILLGKGDGTFQSPITFPAGQFDGYLGISTIDVADFNNDGLLDFVISGGGSNQTGNSTLLLQTPSK